ncbi:hypothetical protein ACF8PD_13695 [Vibrio plantisponsor]|jgi:hypothetical protein|uniref:hypothetical protein n=1 Tax=Vibrio plantisponsor TaxID=664643 RepID=UPI00370B0EA2
MKSGQGKLSERLRNAPHLLADEQYLKWVIEQVEELEKLEVFKIQRRPFRYTPFISHFHKDEDAFCKSILAMTLPNNTGDI